MSTSLPSSDGWKLKKPISIQRFDPRTSEARTNTETSNPIETAYSGQRTRR